MINSELNKEMDTILAEVKTPGYDAKAKEIHNEPSLRQWRIGKYVFSHTIAEGRKYGKATVIEDGKPDVALDTNGFDKVVMCIVYFLRNPKPAKKERAKKEKPTKERKVKVRIESRKTKEAPTKVTEVKAEVKAVATEKKPVADLAPAKVTEVKAVATEEKPVADLAAMKAKIAAKSGVKAN